MVKKATTAQTAKTAINKLKCKKAPGYLTYLFNVTITKGFVPP